MPNWLSLFFFTTYIPEYPWIVGNRKHKILLKNVYCSTSDAVTCSRVDNCFILAKQIQSRELQFRIVSLKKTVYHTRIPNGVIYWFWKAGNASIKSDIWVPINLFGPIDSCICSSTIISVIKLLRVGLFGRTRANWLPTTKLQPCSIAIMYVERIQNIRTF